MGRALPVEPLAERLGRLLADWAPRSVLLVGEDARAAVDAAGSIPEGGRLDELAPDADGALAVAVTDRYDCAVASGLTRIPDVEAARALLARLRDLLAPRVVLIVPAHGRAPGWSRTDLVAFGFGWIGPCHGPHGDVDLFAHDIARYKPTPDWLNARYWAHPERWDRHRW